MIRLMDKNQKKILVSVIFLVRNSGAGNGCTNFMGAWKNALFLQEKPMSIKFLVLGGVFWVWGGGVGSADFIFMGARIFLKKKTRPLIDHQSWSSSGGAPEGATTLLHSSRCSRPFILSVKSTLCDLESCNPVWGTPSSTA